MWMDLGYFSLIVGIVAVVLILTYWAIRLIDHVFRRKETDREYAHEAVLQDCAYALDGRNKQQEQERQYQYQKRLQQSRFDRVKMMTPDLIKQINQSVWEEAKQMMKELQ